MAFPSFGDPVLGDIYRYWRSRRREGKAPRRADIKPGELGPPIRNLNIVEVLRRPGGGLAFRHRLVGTGIIEWVSHDATGRMIDAALYGEAAAAEIIATLTRIVQTGLPYQRVARLDHNNQKFALAESVELPLSDDTNDVAMILRGVSYRHIQAGSEPELFFRPLPLD